MEPLLRILQLKKAGKFVINDNSAQSCAQAIQGGKGEKKESLE